MRKVLFLLCVSWLFLGGCIAIPEEGVFTYHAHGKLVDASSGQPMAGARVYLSFDGRDAANPSWLHDRSAAAGKDGHFEARQETGTAWRQVYFLGLVPMAGFGQAPLPPRLEQVFLFIEIDGQWKTLRVNLNPSQQAQEAPAERWLELGTILISPEKLSPVFQSP
jgi:hypothetical protein